MRGIRCKPFRTPQPLSQLHFRCCPIDCGVQVVPLQQYTLEELAEHDGRDPSKPMLLAIRGVVYNITAGKDFYGPDGKLGGSWSAVASCYWQDVPHLWS
jgi:predicted heme/steroid binding protein